MNKSEHYHAAKWRKTPRCGEKKVATHSGLPTNAALVQSLGAANDHTCSSCTILGDLTLDHPECESTHSHGTEFLHHSASTPILYIEIL